MGMRQFVRMSNNAKLRRMNRAHLNEIVVKAVDQWKVESMKNDSVGSLDQMVEKVTDLLQKASDIASLEPKLMKGNHPPPCPW